MRVVSNELSTQIGTRTLETKQRVDEAKVQASLAEAEAIEHISAARTEAREAIETSKAETIAQMAASRAELTAKRKALEERILSSRHFGAGRLLRAFPQMKHHKYAELLEDICGKLRY
jgi:vacuolar-type H+-ATPase subunit E/Vma4